MRRGSHAELYEFVFKLNSMMRSHEAIGQNESFNYKTVVECLRVSDVSVFLDFELYDRNALKGRIPTLRSKPFRWRDDYNNIFLNAYVEIDEFIRRDKGLDAHFLPFISFVSDTFRGNRIWYRTIPQLVAGLTEIFPAIQEKSLEFIREEDELNENKRRKQEVLESIPNIIKTAMKKDKIMFDVTENDDDTITVSFRMPKRTKLSVKMKVEQVPNDLPYIVNMILPNVSMFESAHRFSVSGYGNNANWKEVEK